MTSIDAESLLDRYLEFIEYRIRNHWVDGDKSGCYAIGMDIKYSQLRDIAPLNWDSAELPFLLGYLKSREAIIIHVIRRNVIQCAISAMIAMQRGVWHNYDGARIGPVIMSMSKNVWPMRGRLSVNAPSSWN